MSPDLGDTFLEEYTRGVTDELRPPPAREAGGGLESLVPAEPFAVGGMLILADRTVSGWVVVDGGRIAEVTETTPTGVRLLATDAVVLPGLLDMHNHPDFNVFAAWEPPEVYPNRYRWRASGVYEDLIKAPNRDMNERLTIPGARLRYAEIRSMVGGVTAIQGMNGTGDTAEPLVRNLDRHIFGAHRARTLIDLPAKVDGFGWDGFARILAAIDAGRVDAFYVHLAEGQPDDPVSRGEFTRLKDFGGLRPQTIIIHGTALTPTELGEAADAGAKLVWSPQSNLRLYRHTTNVQAALDAGLPVCLGADWMPSGSQSLLAELRVAAQHMHAQGLDVDPRMLVEMVTTTAARSAGLAEQLGSLQPGRPADMIVLARLAEDPYRSILLADPHDVELVMIGGDVTYARHDWIDHIGPGQPSPNLHPVIAWGRPMLLDNGYRASPDQEKVPTLDDLRADLTGVFPPLGPIWA